MNKPLFNLMHPLLMQLKYVTVKNICKVAGKEVAQLFVGDIVASTVKPVKKLKEFKEFVFKPDGSKHLFHVRVHLETSLLAQDYQR